MNENLMQLAILVLVVLIGSAFCSGVEAALLTVNPLRVYELTIRKKPVRGAKRLAKLRQRLGRTLTVLVITNNGFKIFGSLMNRRKRSSVGCGFITQFGRSLESIAIIPIHNGPHIFLGHPLFDETEPCLPKLSDSLRGHLRNHHTVNREKTRCSRNSSCPPSNRQAACPPPRNTSDEYAAGPA